MHETQFYFALGKSDGVPCQSMELHSLLLQWFSKHKQAGFARSVGVKDSTVSRWKKKERPPNFENCLNIARVLGEDPLVILEANGNQKYIDLYKRFFPKQCSKPASIADHSFRDEHRILHQHLEEILNGPDSWPASIAGTVEGMHRQMSEKISSAG